MDEVLAVEDAELVECRRRPIGRPPPSRRHWRTRCDRAYRSRVSTVTSRIDGTVSPEHDVDLGAVADGQSGQRRAPLPDEQALSQNLATVVPSGPASQS